MPKRSHYLLLVDLDSSKNKKLATLKLLIKKASNKIMKDKITVLTVKAVSLKPG